MNILIYGVILLGIMKELELLGADIADIEERYLGDTELYIGVLSKFIVSLERFEVMSHFESGDIDGALYCAHSLKGVTGNLSLTPLYKGYSEITSLLRAGESEKARRQLEELLPLQEKFVECVRKYV